MDEDHKVLCRIILEIIGNPKEHVEQSLKTFIEVMKKQEAVKGIKVLKEDIESAEKVGEFWSAFAELEIQFKNIPAIVQFCFDYMPSSIEILEPSSFAYKAHEFSTFFNELQAKLHEYNMAIKNLVAEKAILNRNVLNLTKNAITISLKEKPKNIEEISRDVGVRSEQLKPFLDDFIKRKIVFEQNGTYTNMLANPN